MSINFTTGYTDLGKWMGALVAVNGECGNNANTPGSNWGTAGPNVKSQFKMYQDIEQRLAGSGGGSGLISLIPTNLTLAALQGMDQALSTLKSAIVTDCGAVLVKEVNNDTVQPDTSVRTAMVEWIRQMQVGSVTVTACVVGSTVTAGANNTGNATVMVSMLDPNGLTLENLFQETLTVRCTVDSNHGATAGSETVSVFGPVAVTPVTSFLWPGGSGVNTTTTVIDPTLGNGTGTNANLLTGGTGSTTGAFKAFTGAVPTQWRAPVDAGNVSDGTSSNYGGVAHCLQFTGNTGGTNLKTEVDQDFANGAVTGGANATILPGTVYHLYAKVKVSAVPAAGAISFTLVDGSGNVINNNQGIANRITTTVSAYGGTTYQTVTGAFQTPTILPAKVSLRVRAETQVTTGTNVFVDFLAMVQPPSNGPVLVGSGGSSSTYGGLYPGGPYFSIFRGSTDLVNWISPTVGDFWTVAMTNNYGSTSPTPLSFQTQFNQVFGMAQFGLVLPSAVSGTINNNLIS